MPFSKHDMQDELLTFLSLFGQDVARLYGISDTSWTDKEAVQESPIWQAANDMYDYGINGVPTGDLAPKGHIYGIYGHLERFLRALDTPNMRLYLEASDITLPRLTMLAVQSAVARLVVDDGWRENDYGASEYGLVTGDLNHLTLAEVALLANMDERSVRNAANPKLPDPLKTEQVGKRSLVTPEEARRWLSGRRGFIPTKECDGQAAQRLPACDTVLTPELAETITREAKKAGLSFMDYVERVLVPAYKEIDK